MKERVQGFIEEIVNTQEYQTYKHELMPMQRWAGEMEKGDSLDTNLSIGRLISCASANVKRTREEASQMSEKSTALAAAYKELEEVKADRDAKLHRVTELEGLVLERTDAAQKALDELAKGGHIREKVNFSNRAARENTDDASGAPGQSLVTTSSRASVNMDDGAQRVCTSYPTGEDGVVEGTRGGDTREKCAGGGGDWRNSAYRAR